MRYWLAMALLALPAPAMATVLVDEFPNGYTWNCTAEMDGADGHFSGSLVLADDGSPRLPQIDWKAFQPLQGVEWGAKGTITLSARWLLSYPGEEPFGEGDLVLGFAGEEPLPKRGYFDFGEGPDHGTFVAQYHRNSKDRKTAFAYVDLKYLERWGTGQEQLRWRMQGGEDGVRSGKWVTDGVLPLAFLPRLRADHSRFAAILEDKAARPEEECEKVGNSNTIMI